ncbi:hypothetical protein [Cronobacter sakazakii]|uniref:hypothetical protein n=1 Tax=Cronobacter sakazakii TaxID=28141 RepID=UPI000CFDFAFC|nr:hypothetical protein [Cronobacter sakazakii]
MSKGRAQEIFLGNGPEPTVAEERELARIALDWLALREILDGVPQEAIDGGWTARGLSDYAKQLETELAALRERAEPVAWLVCGSKTFKDRTASTREVAEQAVKDRNDGSCIKPLYAAPPAPVLPDVLTRLRAIVADPRALPRRKEWISGQQYSYVLLENVEAMVDEACRAAVLQPVSSTYKLPEA